MKALPKQLVHQLLAYLCLQGDAKARALFEALEAALAPSAKAKARRKKQADEKKLRPSRKSAETAAIRGEVFRRAGGVCELCAVRHHGDARVATDLHHVFGRRRIKQSASNCMALCRLCHLDITNNRPSADACWREVGTLLRYRGHDAEAERAEARRAFVMARKGAA
jgi:5-methylcytosine-specific restriction endonuclease McrA